MAHFPAGISIYCRPLLPDPGTVSYTHLDVYKRQVVKKGDLLFEIEDTRYREAVEEAVAKKAQLEAKLLYAKNSFERYNRLLASKSVSMDTVRCV